MEINKIKTITLKDQTIEGLAKKIEDYQNSNNLISKGSLPFYDANESQFCVIMFFSKGETPIPEPKKEFKKSNKDFQPSEEQLERWKSIKPTKKTIELLKKLKFSDEDIKHIRTMYDAHTIINNLQKRNI